MEEPTSGCILGIHTNQLILESLALELNLQKTSTHSVDVFLASSGVCPRLPCPRLPSARTSCSGSVPGYPLRELPARGLSPLSDFPPPARGMSPVTLRANFLLGVCPRSPTRGLSPLSDFPPPTRGLSPLAYSGSVPFVHPACAGSVPAEARHHSEA
jgi:hypothetical protein